MVDILGHSVKRAVIPYMSGARSDEYRGRLCGELCVFALLVGANEKMSTVLDSVIFETLEDDS